jgi:hypothetical protein
MRFHILDMDQHILQRRLTRVDNAIRIRVDPGFGRAMPDAIGIADP